jgi:hypothetical protein
MKPGSSRKTISENIREFHHGKTYQRTKRKFGKRKANRQAIAAAYSNARRSKKRHHKNRRSQRSR